MSKNHTKNQHLIPDSYLRHFSEKNSNVDDPDCIYIYNKNSKIIEKSSTSISFTNEFFYEIPSVKINFIEDRVLGKIENRFAPIHNEIVKTGSVSNLTNIQKDIIAKYIYFLQIRNKPFLENTHNILISAFENLHIMPSDGIKYSPLSYHMHRLSKFIPYEKIKHLSEGKFILIKSNGCFFTSDNPVIRFNNTFFNTPLVSPLANHETEVYLPLSPDYCLLIISKLLRSKAHTAFEILRSLNKIGLNICENLVDIDQSDFKHSFSFQDVIRLDVNDSVSSICDISHVYNLIKLYYLTGKSDNIISNSYSSIEHIRNEHIRISSSNLKDAISIIIDNYDIESFVRSITGASLSALIPYHRTIIEKVSTG